MTPSMQAYVNTGTTNHFTEYFGQDMSWLSTNAAWTTSSSGAHVFIFGEGSAQAGMDNFAHAAEVVSHEFGHGAYYELVGFDYLDYAHDPFVDASTEGIADYLAASRTNNPHMLHSMFPDTPQWQRNLESERRYPRDYQATADEHANGQILGSML